MTPPAKIPVAVLGATGQVGQRLVTLLAEHPWFALRTLTASAASAGRRYAETVRWAMTTPIPAIARERVLERTEPTAARGCQIALSALDASVAGPAEAAFAAAGLLVVSNTKSHRMDADVPLVVPEVNPDHLALAGRQRHRIGAIVAHPNCSTIGLAMALAPLDRAFGVERVHVVTMQALSGAGMLGVPALSALDNVIPYIDGEEAKLASEPRKILGRLGPGGIDAHPATISAACNRVPVIDGHLLCVSLSLQGAPRVAAVRAALDAFRAPPGVQRLPSAPARALVVLDGDDAPQPRLHRDLGAGMTISIGRLRPCPLLGLRFVTLCHNTVRGAAGGTLLLAELALTRALVPTIARPPTADATGHAASGNTRRKKDR